MVLREVFIPTWNDSPSLGEAAKRLGMKKHSCRSAATEYRQKGYDLKKMPTIRTSIDERIRFWNYVNKTDGCWLWTGCVNEHGYGQIQGQRGERRVLAHRLSFVIHFGDFDPELNVCHHCDNPPCVRPDHLFLGTDLDNARDMVSKKRNLGCNVSLSEQTVLAVIEAKASGLSYSQTARNAGVSIGEAWKICNGRIKAWQHLIQK